eukprot:TRINITY_DN90886_c0_g1_i1.p1 TRINITY_DN90886_c0_g1~~TRINITY_DN90886_c0_g1_i1.p1  ORF type:complete len:402 (+),score=69.67 TRINITY_DN90886_c0_g1_i1:41-1246(+)
MTPFRMPALAMLWVSLCSWAPRAQQSSTISLCNESCAMHEDETELYEDAMAMNTQLLQRNFQLSAGNRSSRVVRSAGASAGRELVGSGEEPADSSRSSPPGANQRAPLLIYCHRRIKAGMLDRYFADWQVFAEDVFQTNPGVKAASSFIDKASSQSILPVAIQLLWFNDLSAFVNPSSRPKKLLRRLSASYASSASDPDSCKVFGGGSGGSVGDVLKNKAFAQEDVEYTLEPPLAGFMKTDGNGAEGPPIFVFTRHHVKADLSAAMATAAKKVCDSWFEHQPGVLAALWSADEKERNMVHVLRVLSNYKAFLDFVEEQDTNSIAGVQDSLTNYDIRFPLIGEVFADDPQAIIGSDPFTRYSVPYGTWSSSRDMLSSDFTAYAWNEGRIGPMPDMTKADFMR